jgi:predicted phage terminase large subunit-like protein|tara:strand:- start:64 stop:1545 length:1482 start_codon:yes stop_codon:yes gene_type:complete
VSLDFETNNPEEAQALIKKLELRRKELETSERAKNNFLDFVKAVWPEFIGGYHHKKIAEKFELLKDKKLKRLIVNMPPRHTKSEFASYLLPAWIMGHAPKTKIIQATHTGELAFRFGRKVRNLMNHEDYKRVFTDVELSQDSQAAGRWETNHGGEYFATGVGGAITGRGADLLIIDDPHSEQDALSETAFDNAYEWYTSGPRQRLQPGGIIVIVMTRWSTKDLTGKLINAQTEIKADQWDVIEFPAIFPKTGNPIWPEFWKKDELLSVKASLNEQKWQAQWQQSPTSEEGSIIKREWWMKWESQTPPNNIQHIIQSYDTAYSKKETADYSAITTWGVFTSEADGKVYLILLDAIKGRWDFPELKRKALAKYKEYEPETIIIEAKASGLPLTHELRQVGIPVTNFTPSKGNDKHVRVNAVAPVFEAGQVWVPDERWAQEVIEECAAFPFGDNDDYVDSTTQAVLRFRQGNFVTLPDDYWEEPTVPDYAGEERYY